MFRQNVHRAELVFETIPPNAAVRAQEEQRSRGEMGALMRLRPPRPAPVGSQVAEALAAGTLHSLETGLGRSRPMLELADLAAAAACSSQQSGLIGALEAGLQSPELDHLRGTMLLERTAKYYTRDVGAAEDRFREAMSSAGQLAQSVQDLVADAFGATGQADGSRAALPGKDRSSDPVERVSQAVFACEEKLQRMQKELDTAESALRQRHALGQEAIAYYASSATHATAAVSLVAVPEIQEVQETLLRYSLTGSDLFAVHERCRSALRESLSAAPALRLLSSSGLPGLPMRSLHADGTSFDYRKFDYFTAELERLADMADRGAGGPSESGEKLRRAAAVTQGGGRAGEVLSRAVSGQQLLQEERWFCRKLR
jgi:hypothetical protein